MEKKRIEDIVVRSGFKYPVPINSFLFSSGDGDVIEDAPLGYYNLHYFNTLTSNPKGISYTFTYAHLCNFP